MEKYNHNQPATWKAEIAETTKHHLENRDVIWGPSNSAKFRV